jgi:HK97 family phage prohead protease
MKMKTLDVALDLKQANVQPDGTFKGYGSVFGTVDSYNEVVPKGAFARSLKNWQKRGALPSLLWQHDARQPIGIYKSMAEDDHGLLLEGQLSLDTVQGKEAYALLKMGALNGLSIGYNATEWTTNAKSGITTLDVIDLWEVSLVTFPANTDARVDGVKSALKDGKLPSLKDFEGFLRDAGFSRSEAAAIAGKGLRHLISQREADTESLDSILEAIKSKPFAPT